MKHLPRRPDQKLAELLTTQNVTRHKSLLLTRVNALAKYLATREDLPPHQIFNKSRNKRVVFLRIAISYSLRLEGFTLEDIAYTLNRDHSTIAYYLQRAKKILEKESITQKQLKNSIDYLTQINSSLTQEEILKY
jgi:chromosomal replication initiation ATPase DnaA